MDQATQPISFTFMAVLGLVFLVSCSRPAAMPTPMAASPTLTATTPSTTTLETSSIVSEPDLPTAIPQDAADGEVRTGIDELDRIIQIVMDGDTVALRSIIQFTRVECTFEDGLGGQPKCEDGEEDGQTVEVLPFLGAEGHFIRKENIESWVGIDASNLYTVYLVSDAAYSDLLYPSGKYAIAFINEAGFMITTLQIVEGQIVRVDYTMGAPPVIRLDEVDMYLIGPGELDK